MRPIVGVQLTLWLLRMVLLWVGVETFLFQNSHHQGIAVTDGVVSLLGYAMFALFVFGVSFIRCPLSFGMLCLSVVLIPMLPWTLMLWLVYRSEGWDFVVGFLIPASLFGLLALGVWETPHLRSHFRCQERSEPPQPSD
jgi:hypothetical protein